MTTTYAPPCLSIHKRNFENCDYGSLINGLCYSGLISSEKTNTWLPFPNEKTLIPRNNLDLNLIKDQTIIVDHYESKSKAFSSAIELSESLASIGKVLYV